MTTETQRMFYIKNIDLPVKFLISDIKTTKTMGQILHKIKLMNFLSVRLIIFSSDKINILLDANASKCIRLLCKHYNSNDFEHIFNNFDTVERDRERMVVVDIKFF